MLLSIRSIRLDDFFQEQEILPDVVKIDVEGAETQVLKGMGNLLKHHIVYLFVEIHSYEMSDFQSSPEEVSALLIDTGYELFEIPQFRKSPQKSSLKRLGKTTILAKPTMLYAHKTQK